MSRICHWYDKQHSGFQVLERWYSLVAILYCKISGTLLLLQCFLCWVQSINPKTYLNFINKLSESYKIYFEHAFHVVPIKLAYWLIFFKICLISLYKSFLNYNFRKTVNLHHCRFEAYYFWIWIFWWTHYQKGNFLSKLIGPLLLENHAFGVLISSQILHEHTEGNNRSVATF